MQLSTLLNQDFQSAFNTLTGQQMPIKTAHTLKNISKKIQEQLNKYEEARKESLFRHGDKDSDGKPIILADDQVSITPENRELFAKELNLIWNSEVNVGSVKIKDLGDVRLSVRELSNLDGIIT